MALRCREWEPSTSSARIVRKWRRSRRGSYPRRDLVIVDNTPIDYLDFASPESGLGSKIGLDATNKWPPETKREWGRKIRMADDVIEQVTKRWGEYGLPGSGKPIWK